MPSKNIIKPYLAGGYYHIYNRGVNKRTIFKDEQDYSVFSFVPQNLSLADGYGHTQGDYR